MLQKSFSMIPMEMLKHIDDLNFDIFKFKSDVGGEFVLSSIANYIFSFYELFDTLNFEKFEKFLTRTRLGYFCNPYHNDIHATDVLQTCYLFCKHGNLTENCHLSNLDISAMFVAALLHDIGHPGLNNSYHINKVNKLSLRYNDKSVLENFHCSEGYKIMQIEDSNILQDLKKEELRIFRKRMIESILATDMSCHTKVFSTMKCLIDNNKDNNNDNWEENIKNIVKASDNNSRFDRQQDCINFVLHTADISNTAKKSELSLKWTEYVTKEFFAQGDLEKSYGLPVSFLCDRTTTNIPKSQIGFINSIVWPLFNVLSYMIPSMKYYEKNLEENCNYWKNKLEGSTENDLDNDKDKGKEVADKEKLKEKENDTINGDKIILESPQK